MKIFIKTLKDLEGTLEKEIRSIGGKNVKLENRGVACEGDLKFLYRANYELRTALRVLTPIYEFIAHTERDFYRKIKKFDWSTVLSNERTFAVDAVSNSRVFNHSKFIALRAKDAIVDQFVDQTGKRPNVDTDRPDVLLNIHISELKVVVSLDSSGDSLHKRGYRIPGHEAPINEVLAAGMLLMSDWDRKIPFVDPMCGSGTFLAEAVMLASNIPPQIINNELGFMRWDNFDENLWNEVKKEAKLRMTSCGPILGFDIDSRAVEMTKKGLSKLGVDGSVQVEKASFFTRANHFEKGLLMFNPPYGERLKEEDILAFYKEIGDTMKTNYKGFQAWIISSNLEAIKRVGLRPSRKFSLLNGALPCKLHVFDMYDGSKKGANNSAPSA